MITLYSYPDLFGVADNNPYGLKVFAFLRLARLAFQHKHVLDASQAPRGQLPYIVDGAETIGDSDAIISYLTSAHDVQMDAALTAQQQDTSLLVRRLLDDLYWVMSYSRWKDPVAWPAFRDALHRAHPAIAIAALEGAQQYNYQRYHYQGIGRFERDAVYARGIADLDVIARLLPERGFVFGPAPCSLDAALYGFTANIYFYDIDTPLKRFLLSCPSIVAHCRGVHAVVSSAVTPSNA